MPELAPLDRGNYPPTARQLKALAALGRALAAAGRPGAPGTQWAAPSTRRQASSLIRTLRHELTQRNRLQEAPTTHP